MKDMRLEQIENASKEQLAQIDIDIEIGEITGAQGEFQKQLVMDVLDLQFLAHNDT